MIPVRSGHHLVSPLIDGVNMGLAISFYTQELESVLLILHGFMARLFA
jgi:hypothetical protein